MKNKKHYRLYTAQWDREQWAVYLILPSGGIEFTGRYTKVL